MSISAYDGEASLEAWSPGPAGAEYGFLVGRVIDRATLDKAGELAGDWDVDVADVLIANGWVHPTDYARALAEACDVEFVEPDQTVMLAPVDEKAGPQACLSADILRYSRFGTYRTALAQPSLPPGRLRQRLSQIGDVRHRLAFTTRADVLRTVCGYFSHQLVDQAANGLSRRFPGESAATLFSRGQLGAIAVAAVVSTAAVIFEPLAAVGVAAHLAAAFFLLVAALPIPAIVTILSRRLYRGRQPTYRLHDSILPVYTILVPLLHEDRVLEDLARSLKRLDYPPAKLDIKLVFEGSDHQTLAFAEALGLPGNVDLITVPDSRPKSKAKALNYALNFARGDYVVVYDADDRPEPEQLRKALLAFQEGPANLACVQARLNVYNGQRNWLTRQFAAEVSALYDGLLPSFTRLALPIPLGRTSCHFRLSVLKWLGGWDAFNVAQDADLGIRLARRGYECRVLDSATLGEAACSLGAWRRQRTRWIKGWIQTYVVHMRKPRTLWRELGARGFFSVQLLMGGTTLAGLALPLLGLAAAAEFAASEWLAHSGSLLGISFWLLAGLALTTAYVGAMVLGFLCLEGRAARLAVIPAYWLLISLASYRALFQLFADPQLWEKTEHGVSTGHDAFAPRVSD